MDLDSGLKNVGVHATALPVQELDSLLDTDGIEQSWKRILLTHAVQSRSRSGVEASPIFTSVPKLQKDLLAGLSVGNISVLYEYSLAYVDTKSRKDAGQFFTPDDVAIRLATFSESFPKVVQSSDLSKNCESAISGDRDAIWLDPCSGVGNLSFHLAQRQTTPKSFVKNSLILVDKDPLALLIARVLFSVSFGAEDSSFFEDIEQNFQQQDFLTGDLPEFDYAILNPPYVVVSENIQFETAKCRDLYAYFLERVIKNGKGFISINPQSFTHAKKFSSLRKLMETHLQFLSIYSFDNIPDNVFRGVKFGTTNTNTANSIRPSIVVGRAGDGSLTQSEDQKSAYTKQNLFNFFEPSVSLIGEREADSEVSTQHREKLSESGRHRRF